MSQGVPRIAITLGDPTGVGPEIAVKALAKAQELSGNSLDFTAILVGDKRVVEAARSRFATQLATTRCRRPCRGRPRRGSSVGQASRSPCRGSR